MQLLNDPNKQNNSINFLEAYSLASIDKLIIILCIGR